MYRNKFWDLSGFGLLGSLEVMDFSFTNYQFLNLHLWAAPNVQKNISSSQDL